MGLTFSLIVMGWIFFRAENLTHLTLILKQIFSPSLFTVPYFFGRLNAFYTLVGVVFFILIEWFGRESEYAIQTLGCKWKTSYRWLFYYGLIYVILIFAGSGQKFIYFQF